MGVKAGQGRKACIDTTLKYRARTFGVGLGLHEQGLRRVDAEHLMLEAAEAEKGRREVPRACFPVCGCVCFVRPHIAPIGSDRYRAFAPPPRSTTRLVASGFSRSCVVMGYYLAIGKTHAGIQG